MNWNNQNLKVPWVVSPFFKKQIDERLSKIEPEKRERYFSIASKINDDGYCNIGKVFKDSFCDEMILETQALIEDPSIKIQDEHYNYNKSARIFEAWRNSASVSCIACNQEILEILLRQNLLACQCVLAQGFPHQLRFQKALVANLLLIVCSKHLR